MIESKKTYYPFQISRDPPVIKTTIDQIEWSRRLGKQAFKPKIYLKNHIKNKKIKQKIFFTSAKKQYIFPFKKNSQAVSTTPS